MVVIASGKHTAIENGPVEIVDLPMNSMVIFHSFFVNVYRRVGGISRGCNGILWMFFFS